ncbi:hypothetical protein ACJRO7_012234 [Eucalyptus globulus]|uniref:Protein NRT1/ PTR FAMILY 3.1 n=1 Tax=Eucalyptus globulus TaxID=34317 RepID=A0ABD3LIZ6_EUCGL
MEERDQKHGTKRKGGMVTMPFIFANEVCDKLAVVGFNANMINYLTTKIHMPMTKAANTLTNFGGTASLTPLLGAYVADAYAGRFWTITVASVVYVVGMTLLTLSAVIPQLLPPPCNPSASSTPCQEANGGQLAVLYVALLLGAIGSGGIRPCVVAFGADQFDETDPKQSTKTWKYFNWYYFVMGVSILVALTVVVYVQEDVGWGLGLGIPTVLMFLSVIALVCGFRLYRILDPAGSPFTRLLQVLVAAFRKRKVRVSRDGKAVELYRNDELDAAISLGGRLVHTKHMEFLDKAAIVTQEDNLKSPDLWRLSTVHRVEELKSVIRMGPIWAAGILLFTAYAQQNTFSIQQAKTMDRHLSRSFQVPSGSMQVFTTISMLATIAFYDRVFVPVASRFTGLERGITFLHRMGIGFAISILATLVAGLVEVKRKQAAVEYGLTDSPHSVIPISAFWLVPQYSLHGIAEAFMSIGHLEFFYDQAPESMRSTATALFWTTISAGNYLSTLLVSVIHRVTAGDDGSNWLPDNNLNRGKLEYFYWLLTLLQTVNFVYYVCCARFYTFKPVQVHGAGDGDKSEEDEVELARRV